MTRSVRNPDWPAFLIVLLGAVVVIAGTRWGPGTSPDSITYLGVSTNLASGRGLTVPFGEIIDAPLGNFPPVFPVLLGIIVRLGISADQAARIAQTLVMVVNLLLVRALVREGLQRATGFESIGMLLLLASPVMVMLHWMAWSEALFIALGFGGLLQLLVAIRKGGTLRLLLGSILIALSAITRYAGISFIITGFIILLLNKLRSRPVEGARQLITYSLFSCLPLIAWLFYVFLLSRAGTGREFAFHIPEIEKLKIGLTAAAGWLSVPADWPTIIKVTFLGIFAGGIVVSSLGASRAGVEKEAGAGKFPSTSIHNPVALGLLIFVLVYVLVILGSITFFDANTPLDNRLLSPVLLALMLITTMSVGTKRRTINLPAAVTVWLPILSMLLLASQAAAVPGLLKRGYQEGFGFNSVEWRSSGLIKYVLTFDRSEGIYSNSPEAIYARTEISTYRLPRPYIGVLAARNPNYEQDLKELADKLDGGEYKIVYFDRIQGASIPPLDELEDKLSVNVLLSAADGFILGRPQ